MEKTPKKLTAKQKAFCKEYIFDWNATRAAKAAGYSKHTAKQIATENLSKPYLQEYISELQKDIGKVLGITKLMVVEEHRKMAFSSIAHMHNTWVDLKEFEELTDNQKSSIAEISTRIVTIKQVKTEQVKIKLHDKNKNLESLARLLGFNEPEKADITSKGEKIEAIDLSKLDVSTLLKIKALGSKED